MYFTRQLVVCFLLYNFNTLVSFEKNEKHLIAAAVLQPLKSRFFGKTPSPQSNPFSTTFRAAIEATKFVPKYMKPLFLFTALEEKFLLNQTTESLKVKLDPKSVGSITGGVLGDEIYQVDHFYYIWKNTWCNGTHNLKARAYLYNWKYENFYKAMDYRDGVAVVNIPISNNGDVPNWKFDELSKILGKKIKEPGDYIDVHSACTYTWFVNFPYDSIYYTYEKELFHDSAGRKYIARIIDLPLDPRLNYISNEQFVNTFGKIKQDPEDETIGDAFVRQDFELSKERYKGICVVNLPA